MDYDIVVQPMKIFVEYVGVIMGIQVTLMIIDRRGVSIMYACSRNHRVTHLTYGNARVALGYFDGEKKIVRVSDVIRDITRRSGMARR